MDYENFKEELIEGLKENFEARGIEGMSFRDQGQVNKLNGGYDGVVVTPQDSAIGVTVNMTKLYEAHENGAPIGEIIDKAADMVVNGLDNQPKIDVATLTDYDQMREKLIMEVVSTEANKEMLSNIPHKEMEDMSVVYRFEMGTNEDGRASILVTNQLMDSMGINAAQLHADAVENAPKIKPVEIKGMGEVLSEMMGMSPEDMAMMGMPTDPADEKIFVATVPDKVHGAGVLAYQDFMDQAAERVGGECLGLRWEDLDFENKVISINHAVTYYRSAEHGRQLMSISLPKTEAGIRTIPMLDVVKEAFLMEKEQQFDMLGGLNEQIIDGMSGFVFQNADGRVPNPQTVNRTIKRIVETYNSEELLNAAKEKRDPELIPNFSCHVLRHTFATRLCEAESNLKVIQSVMGHRNIETTMDIYAEATEEKKQETFEGLASKLDNLF